MDSPKELPAALCGDRHQILPLPDGRLLVQFRDVPRPGRKGRPPARRKGTGWDG
ncbi:hypothetical protein M5E88_05815 [Akkermansia muciniphila]|nr:hypothetical protein M5E88_05815 [Akkermansia muciniphila]